MDHFSRETGVYQRLGSIECFIPHPLPPNPPLDLGLVGMELFGEAMHAIGELNGMAQLLPDMHRFIRAYIIKEALLSSAIEGIYTTILDVFTQPISGGYVGRDTQLVINYTAALEVALQMLEQQGCPISSRLLLATHEALMSGGGGEAASPGMYRKQAVRVGNLVPPPAPLIAELIADLEIYINTDTQTPPLIRAGLVHVHFEMIHPFLDGNGRVGRLLILLMLLDAGVITAPIVYPSFYFKKHHQEYYQRLDAVRTQGDFEGWITYYLKAVKESAQDACARAKQIQTLEADLKKSITDDIRSGSLSEIALPALDYLFHNPVVSVSALSQKLSKAYNTANAVVSRFVEAGILAEITGQRRNKLYRFEPYLQILERTL
jgi:Fic family protein